MRYNAKLLDNLDRFDVYLIATVTVFIVNLVFPSMVTKEFTKINLLGIGVNHHYYETLITNQIV